MNAAATFDQTTLQSAGLAVRAAGQQTSYALCSLLGGRFCGYQGWLSTR